MHFPSPEEWLRLVSEFRASGQSQKEFAAKHDLSLGTLQYWLYRKSKRASVVVAESAPKFLPIEVVASTAPKARAALGSVEVLLPVGVVLRFAPGTDARYVAELCAALR